MTRLKKDDLTDIIAKLNEYDNEMEKKTGATLRQIACHAFGIPEDMFIAIANTVEVGVIPSSSGIGIIEGFSDTVKCIVEHIGFRTFLSGETDVAGIAEAVERNAEVIMMADDKRFVALNIKSGRMQDNADATARGYVAGLDLMAGGLKDKNLLIIGCGAVGRSAVHAGLQHGAYISIYDIKAQRSHELLESIEKKMQYRVTIVDNLESALSDSQYLVEATDSDAFIDAGDLAAGVHVAAPGMPLGLTDAALEKVGSKILHDPLQIGTAVMGVGSVMSRTVEEWRVMLPYGSWTARPDTPAPGDGEEESAGITGILEGSGKDTQK